MVDPRSLAAFLDQVHRQVTRLGPREHLAVERLLRARHGGWPRAELRAALASLLARGHEDWQRVATLFDRWVAGDDEEPGGASGGTSRRASVVGESGGTATNVVDFERPGLRHRLRRGWHRLRSGIGRGLRHAPRQLWIGGIVTVLAIGVAVPLYHLAKPEPPVIEGPNENPPSETPDPSTPREDDFILRRFDTPSTRVDFHTPPTADPGILATLGGLAFILFALGLRWVGLGPVVAAAQQRQLGETRRASHARRHRLEEAKAAAGRPIEVRYKVEQHLPVARQAVLDSADYLGRLVRQEQGVTLDARATLDRTVAAAGRFSPMLEARRIRHEVLVLVDVEEGDHPWLGGFRRLLEAWRAQGVVSRCWEYHFLPDSLIEGETGETLRIGELARLTEGLPLILFSRHPRLDARRGRASWPDHLAAWPCRAWLDPDPRQPAELTPDRRRAVARLERLGLHRFQLDDVGVVELARWLAAEGEGSRGAIRRAPSLPRWAAGADQEADAALAEALRRWALAAALVPDPTWDQLEAIRRHFPSIHRVASEPRYLQRLLEWVEDEVGHPALTEQGHGLAIPEAQQNGWLLEQRRREADSPAERGFENAIRELLLDQLGSTRPEDPLDRQWWRFKGALHRAILEPHRAAELLAWVGDSAIAHEALRWIEGELDRQQTLRHERRGKEPGTAPFPGLFPGLFPEAETETLRRLLAPTPHRLPLPALVWGHGRLWARSLALAAGATLILWLGLGRAAAPIAEGHPVATTRQVEGDPVYELIEARMGPRPTMIRIEGGEFSMGSEHGDPDEVPVHPVKVAPFELSKTEVTVAQYRACVEAAVCAEPDPRDTCNWGQDGRDDHPINCVSWDDARDYAQWIEARLPSEAEWEYAARGGGLEREYPWGDEPADCQRAIIHGDEGAGCGRASTWSVCSKEAGNTPQGLCDMAGNVWEWVEDDWHGTYTRAPAEGSAWVDSPRASYRVIRGGSWRDYPRYARVAYRFRGDPSWRNDNVGFRVARSLPSSL